MTKWPLTEQIHELYGTSFANVAPDTNPPDRRMVDIDYSEIEARALALGLASRQCGKTYMLMEMQKAEAERITGTNPELMIVDDYTHEQVGKTLQALSEPEPELSFPENRRSKRQKRKILGRQALNRKLFRP